ncbi:NAD-dependent epimerase/dehydratase family protein [Oryzifoliimicrobium ureilyticus]|uniref:NAD-dependent epimerase/dehydratase family protein n=1 Tax=Oryzifoliimicrobium ureilyticus TaxID=3113724 RepID=UPI0030761D8A
MKVLVSGGMGIVGRYIVEELLSKGYKVIIGGRQKPLPGTFSQDVPFTPLSLDPDAAAPDAFDDAYFFVHAGFAHKPGYYRGGEGDDPGEFQRLNLEGSVRLFEAAKRSGIRRCVFLSSRAAYGDEHAPGTLLTETTTATRQSLYGEIKAKAEGALADLAAPGFATASLRSTGVYGELTPVKWDGLVRDYLTGHPVAARAGTEVHGRDLARAVRLMLETEAGRISGQIFNVSDIAVDTRDILSIVRTQVYSPHLLPPPSDKSALCSMDTKRLQSLGWSPGGWPALERTLHQVYGETAGMGSSIRPAIMQAPTMSASLPLLRQAI